MRAILIVFVVAFVICFMFMSFAAKHADQRVDIHKQPFADGTFSNVALAEVVLWSFVAGTLMSTVIFMLAYVKQSVQMRGCRKRIRALEGEVTILRNRPIEESAELLKGADLRSEELQSPFDKESRG